jgi:hypothetical protein
VNQDGNPIPCNNDGNAFDGNLTTFTNCTGTFFVALGEPEFTNKQVIYLAFPPKQGNPNQVTLNVKSSGSKNANCASVSMGMQYSLNAGTSWTNITGQQGVFAVNTAQVPLSNSQDFTKVQVRGTAECNSVNSGLAL